MNAEVVAVVRNMLANPNDPAPWLAQYSELAATMFAAGGDPQQIYRSLRQSYLTAIQTPEDLIAAQQVAISSSSAPVFGGAAPAEGGAALASTIEAESQAVVYFVNGIFTQEVSAIDSTRLLERLVVEAHPELASTKFDYFYNRSGLDSNSATSTACGFLLNDLLPLFLRCTDPNRAAEPLTLLLCNTSTLSLLAEWIRVRDICVAIGGFVADGGQALAQWVDELWDSLSPDAAFLAQTQQLAAKLKLDVAAGRPVVVVCHSQGNFFTEAALDLLPIAIRNGIGVVSVASPTIFEQKATYGYFGYHLLEQDFIRITFTAPTPNRTNEQSESAAMNGCNMGACVDGIAVHYFATSYLAYPESRDPIVEDVFQALKRLRSGLQVSSLPSPNASSSGPAELVSVSAVDGANLLAVTWSSNDTSLKNVFLQESGTWSAVASVPFGTSASPAVANSTQGVAVLGDGEYVSFSPLGTLSGPTPSPSIRNGSGTAWIRASKPMFVRRGEVLPNALLSAEYESALDTWQMNFNATGATIDTGGLILPYPSGFQSVRSAILSSSQFTITAHPRDPEGVDLGEQILITSPNAVWPVGSATGRNQNTLLVAGELVPAGGQILSFDFSPLSNWSSGQIVGTMPNPLMFPSIAIGPSGEGLIAHRNASGTGCIIFWREAGSASWQQETFANVGAPVSASISTGGFLVATGRIIETLDLILIGKQPGSNKPWRQSTSTNLGGALPESILLAGILIRPTTHGRFLVVAGVVPLITFVQTLAAALVRI